LRESCRFLFVAFNKHVQRAEGQPYYFVGRIRIEHQLDNGVLYLCSVKAPVFDLPRFALCLFGPLLVARLFCAALPEFGQLEQVMQYFKRVERRPLS